MSMQRSIIIFAKRHSAAGRADDGEVRLELSILRKCFFESRDHHARSAMNRVRFFSGGASEKFVPDLPGGLASALIYSKTIYWTNAIPTGTERVESIV